MGNALAASFRSLSSSLSEERQIDAIGHRFVAVIFGMQVIPAVKGRRYMIRIGGVSNGLVEVNHGVKGSAGADPLIHRFALHFFRLGEIAGKHGASEWRQGATVDFDALFVGALSQLLQTRNDVFGADLFVREEIRSRMAEIVNAFQYDYVFDPGWASTSRSKRASALTPKATFAFGS
jgi:hypothetical protein